MADLAKVVVTVPEKDADQLRKVIGEAGGGRARNYSFCSFSVKGVGRFLPEKGAKPAVGEVGKLEEVVEERIEVTCERSISADVVAAIREAHPYEEPVIDVYPLLSAE